MLSSLLNISDSVPPAHTRCSTTFHFFFLRDLEGQRGLLEAWEEAASPVRAPQMLPPSLGQLDKPLQPPAANCSLGETESPQIKPTQPWGSRQGGLGLSSPISLFYLLPAGLQLPWPHTPMPPEPRRIRAEKVSPFHGFSLEPLDILG